MSMRWTNDYNYSNLNEKCFWLRIYMEIGIIFKIAAVGILVSILSQVLKHSGREEQAFLTSLAGLLLVLSWIIPYIINLFDYMKKLFDM